MTEWTGEFEAAMRRNLPRLGPAEDLAPGDRLVDLGLDSMSTIELLVDVEAALGVEVPDDLLVPETFETVATLWRVVAGLQRSAAT